MRHRDPMGFFQRIKSLNIENKDACKVGLQYIRDKEGRTLRDPGLVYGMKARSFGSLLNANSDRLRHDISNASPLACHSRFRGRTDKKRGYRSLEVDGKHKASGTRRTPG